MCQSSLLSSFLSIILLVSSNSFTLSSRPPTIISLQMASNKDFTKPKHVVIAGAGVIGTSTAYYLKRDFDISSTILDPTGSIAPAASGKAGGFLAKDWNDRSPTQQLTRRSFQLHQELADNFGADSIQYRRLTCAAISVDPYSTRRPQGKKLDGIEWADSSESGVLGMRSLGDTDTIAQVHPKLLCERMWESIQDSCTLQQAKVVGAKHDKDGKLIGAQLDNGSIVQADALLFACGPWTANIMYGIKYHSAVVPTSKVLSQCVFFSGCGDPEVYVRPDSTAYCTGFPDPPVQVTEQPGQESVRSDKIGTILQSVRDASGNSETGGALSQEPVIEQACYLPTTDDGLPVMGLLPEESVGGGECYIAAGHSCWGILMGPGTGEAMASLIATGKSTEHVDLRRFDPSRYKGVIRPVSTVSK